ncbi:MULTISPECIES: hypothetical protein [unclassified Aureispira]|uniref:hypothetical protein n=1 Tax=unclassified Aureispira TaxID=2649989 RepID=UPI0006961995|nr:MULTISPECIES: hypothetical protein [unclassified Aureispira]WMX14513.1 hypothetical protein QP953_27020 [Aureispira sp. CCB-E]
MKIQESKFGQFEAFKVNNLKNIMGGKQIEDVCTYEEGSNTCSDSIAVTVEDDGGRFRDQEFDCADSTPTGLEPGN